MLVAMNEKKQLVTASEELERKEDLFCPSCKGRVHLKKGAVMRPHFAHYRRTNCEAFAEGETAEHVAGKMQLKDWFKKLGYDVALEAYLPELRQRPDLLLDNKLAVEFQCSSIPIDKMRERTRGYADNGFEVIWILGERFEYGKKLTAFQKACLFQVDNILSLFTYSAASKKLTVHYDFQLKQNQKMISQKTHFRFGEKINFKPQAKKQHSQRINFKKVHRQLRLQANKAAPFMELLYKNRESIISMPKELYITVPHEWLVPVFSYEWKYRFILCLEEHPLRTVITERMLFAWWAHNLQPLYEFIAILVQSGVLKEVSKNKWTVISYPKRYTFLEEKVR